MIDKRLKDIENFLIDNNPTQTKHSTEIDFKKVIRYDIALSDFILDNFQDAVKFFELKCESHLTKMLPVKFINIPNSEFVDIWKIRSDSIGKFIGIKGYIRKATEIFHVPTVIKYECVSCGNLVPIMQLDENIKKPKSCQCGCRGFKENSRISKDQQKIIIEEDIQGIDPTQKPRRMVVVLEDNLCHKDIDKEIQAGRKVLATGILQEKSKDKSSLIQVKFLLANNILTIDDTISSLKVTAKEKESISKEVNKLNFKEKVLKTIFGTIHGHSEVKNAMLLHLIGGDHLMRNNKLEERGNIHILLVSSPGSAKTKFLKSAMRFMPNSRFTSGSNSSGVGLIATVTKDEEMGGWSLESGVMPMANKSSLMLDEGDKLNDDDFGKLNNALVDLEVSIDKASIHTVIQTDVSVVMTANPKNRVFDTYEKIWKQIKFPKDFLDRFDLVIPMETIKTEEHQRKITSVIFNKYKEATQKSKEDVFEDDFVIKYITYAKNYIKPIMTNVAEKKIEDLYINLIKPTEGDEQSYMSTRLLTNVIRLATASAKSRLSNTVDEVDAKTAMDLLIYSLKKQEIIKDDENGSHININEIENVLPQNKRNSINAMYKSISEFKNPKTGLTSFEDIASGFKLMTGKDEIECANVLEKLNRQGEVIQPKPGFYRLLE